MHSPSARILEVNRGLARMPGNMETGCLMNQGSTVEAKHLTIIRARLRALLHELRDTPHASQTGAVAEVKYLLLQLGESKDAEMTDRLIELEQLRKRLAVVPGAQRALEAVDFAIAEGVK
jgi:hypothetical protein